MKIVFMGTPDFAVPSFEALVKQFDVKAIITQPDRPKGRGKKITISQVKEAALKYRIPIFQPKRLRKDQEIIKKIKEIKPDFIVVVAFGQILSKEILNIPKYGCINLHASLLPKYRGAAPINWSIIRGEKTTGNTTMLMDEGLDTGDILLKQEVDIQDNMTAEDLHNILMQNGANLLVDTLKKFANGKIKPIKQPEKCEFYASMLNKKMGKIDWNRNCNEIHNFVRGMNQWPIAYTNYNGKTMKIYNCISIDEMSNKEPGTIIDVSKKGIKVTCKDKCILINKIQFPGKKALFVSEYIKGNTIENGIVLK